MSTVACASGAEQLSTSFNGSERDRHAPLDMIVQTCPSRQFLSNITQEAYAIIRPAAPRRSRAERPRELLALRRVVGHAPQQRHPPRRRADVAAGGAQELG